MEDLISIQNCVTSLMLISTHSCMSLDYGNSNIKNVTETVLTFLSLINPIKMIYLPYKETQLNTILLPTCSFHFSIILLNFFFFLYVFYIDKSQSTSLILKALLYQATQILPCQFASNHISNFFITKFKTYLFSIYPLDFKRSEHAQNTWNLKMSTFLTKTLQAC